MTGAVDISGYDDEYTAAAVDAVRTSGGAAALDVLGWWELLDDIRDPENRSAVFSLFRGLGRELESAPALGGLLAQPVLEQLGMASGSAIATIRSEGAEGHRHLVLGQVAGRDLLVDDPGAGVVIVRADRVELDPVEVPGRMVLNQVVLRDGVSERLLDERGAAVLRPRAMFLGRTAAALEMLGAAEGALALALQHAADREQFGEPIGRFQAVRHLLAWAMTDCVAIWNVCREAVELDLSAPPRYDEVVKALAGRNARRACERALQVLGGVGFTIEHSHHHFHSRVLALDAVLGTSTVLTAAIGTWVRIGGRDSYYPATMLGVHS